MAVTNKNSRVKLARATTMRGVTEETRIKDKTCDINFNLTRRNFNTGLIKNNG